MARKKVSVVGSGFVGSTLGHILICKELADVVLVDIESLKSKTKGKALDMAESTPVHGSSVKVIGGSDYSDTINSDVVVITAGIPRRPGMTREDLISTNADITKKVTEEIVSRSPDSILIYVTNPLDAIVYLGHKISGFPRNRVIGQAGVLDTARYRYFVAEALGVSVRDVQAMVLGGHGDDMVPLTRHTSIGGVPMDQLLDKDIIDGIVERTRKGGGEIVGLLEDGSAYYAPAASVAEMVESILKDQKRVLPVTALLQGEYGLENMFIGVPTVLGENGLERVIEVDLDDSEKSMFDKSVESVRFTLETLDKMGY
ncbi:MAG: malate dehydrogenase [Gammaproteobacteria bacterium]|nr:malate dehydrogenase [Gammaproteobacteria bacterium]HAJ06673.1 malate dehydrogenase [Chloroflexota bacterium]|tara:strand:- start:670 stop:1614 length:945 start_codon:yes stop_codon:yes gene_type:complete